MGYLHRRRPNALGRRGFLSLTSFFLTPAAAAEQASGCQNRVGTSGLLEFGSDGPASQWVG